MCYLHNFYCHFYHFICNLFYSSISITTCYLISALLMHMAYSIYFQISGYALSWHSVYGMGVKLIVFFESLRKLCFLMILHVYYQVDGLALTLRYSDDYFSNFFLKLQKLA